MIAAIHSTLQHLLYERGQMNPHEVDITFEAPTRERIEKLIQPTISVFLYNLHENTDLRQGSFQTTQQNGRTERRMVPRRFDLCYMVAALTTNVEDEHQLLWRALVTLLQHPQFPADVLSEELRALEPPLTTRVSQMDEGQSQFSIWTALGIPPHPALFYVVTVPVDMNLVIESPLVLTRTTRYIHTNTREVRTETLHHIGGVVRNTEGKALADVVVTIEGSAADGSKTDSEGRFKLYGVPSGTVGLHVRLSDGSQNIVTVEVPPAHSQNVLEHESQSYDIVLEAAR